MSIAPQPPNLTRPADPRRPRSVESGAPPKTRHRLTRPSLPITLSGLISGLTRRRIDMQAAAGGIIVAAAGAVAGGTAAGRLAPREGTAAVPTNRVEGARR